METTDTKNFLNGQNEELKIPKKEESPLLINNQKISIAPTKKKNVSKKKNWLANKKAFLIVFCLTCVLQGTFHTYFVAVITTLEKLFNIPSRTIGALMMASEVGQVATSLFLPYYAGQGHRPRWMGFGSALFSLATLLCASPHLILPDPTLSLSHFSLSSNSTSPQQQLSLCNSIEESVNCTEEFSMETEGETTKKYYLFGVIFLSLLSIGFGQCAIFTLGIPYLDDNVGNRESPVYFSITIGIRILGPVLGFILGSLCTRLYIHPFTTPPEGLTPSSPHWLGAWWLGMIFISISLLISSFFMCSFPRELRKQKNITTPTKTTTKNSFLKSLKRLLGNKLLVLRTFSSVFHLLPISGLYTFLPKYLESEFSLAAFEANILTGIAGILVMGIGIFASGWFIRKREPSAKGVAVWVCLSAGGWAVGMGVLAFYSPGGGNVIVRGCGGDLLVTGSDVVIRGEELPLFGGMSRRGWDRGELEYTMDSTPTCITATCRDCPVTYSPVCGSDGRSWVSPCHAGCATTVVEGGVVVYTNCSCIATSNNGLLGGGTATAPTSSDSDSSPKTNRTHLLIYLLIFMSIVLLHSTSEVGSMLLTLRCVEPRDKAMALGLIQCAIGVFGNVPCPLVYGMVVDAGCVVWSGGGAARGCGQDEEGEEVTRGHCWEYDKRRFRVYFHGLTALLMTLAFLIDLIVVFKADEVKNFIEDKKEEETNKAINEEEMVELKSP